MSNTSIGIDIGLSSLKLVELVKRKDSYLLKEAAVKYFSFNGTDERESAYISALKEWQVKFKLNKNKNVFVSLPVGSVFLRYFKIVSSRRKSEREIIEYEAKEEIPVPLDEVVWDYKVVSESSKEKEIALIALKSDFVRENIRIVEAAGFKVGFATIGGFSLLNLVKLNKSLSVKNGVIFVDIGAEYTGITIKDGNAVWMRNFSFGGNKFTDGIAEHCGVSFEEAEEIKIKGPEAISETDKIPLVKEAVLYSMENLVSEIERTINFYKVDRLSGDEGAFANFVIVVTGGGSNIGGIDKFMSDKLGIPTEILSLEGYSLNIPAGVFKKNQFDRLSFENDDMGDVLSPFLSEAVGAALYGFKKCKDEINFVKEDVKESEELNLSFIISILTYFLFFGSFFLFFASQWYMLKSKDVMETKFEEVIENVETVSPKLDSVLNRQESVRDEIGFYADYLQKRFLWLDLLNVISRNLPRGVWISDVKSDEDTLSIQGKTVSYDEFDRFILALKKEDIMNSVKPESITGKKSPFNFLLNLSVKKRTSRNKKRG